MVVLPSVAISIVSTGVLGLPLSCGQLFACVSTPFHEYYVSLGHQQVEFTMPLSAKSLAGPGYIILNGLRIMNIVSLTAILVACIVMLIKTVVVSEFFFFDAATHVTTFVVAAFLTVSELSLLRKYFAKNWPLLSPDHGFVTLGLAMEAIGVSLLSNLNQPALSRQNLDLAFWRIVVGAGVLALVLGILNIGASYVFRDSDLRVTARQVRAKGAVALIEQRYKQRSYDLSSSTDSSTSARPSRPRTVNSQATTQAQGSMAKSRTSVYGPYVARAPTLPSSYTGQVPRPTSSRYSDRGIDDTREMRIPTPLSVESQFVHLVRPDSAYHPSRRLDGSGRQ